MKVFTRRSTLRLLLLASSAQMVACSQPSSAETTIAPEALLKQIEAGTAPLLLDVRSPQEYAEGHVPGAINIDYRELESRLDELDAFRTSAIIVYCERGVRARRAEGILKTAGFSQIIHLEGHMQVWRQQGQPTETQAQTGATSGTDLGERQQEGHQQEEDGAIAPEQLEQHWIVTAAVAQALVAQGATLLDAQGGQFGVPRLQGSIPVRWDQFTPKDKTIRGRLLKDDPTLEKQLRSLGISHSTPVVVFGNLPKGWGEDGRIVWMLRTLGHRQAVMVDGGVKALQTAGIPLGKPLKTARSGDFVIQRTLDWDIQQDELYRLVSRGNFDPNTNTPPPKLTPTVLIDTREHREYQGETPYGEQRGGHIPGAIHLYFKDLLGSNGMLLSEQAVHRKLESLGITTESEVIAYCTGGIRSAWLTAVLAHFGYSVRNYAGSMWEWSAGSGNRYPLERE